MSTIANTPSAPGGKDKDLGFDPDSPDVKDPGTDPPHPPPIDNPAKDADKKPDDTHT